MRWDADRYVDEAAFVPSHGVPVVDVLAPQPGERILDLGCGDGGLTERIAAHGVAVVGVDSSAEMVAVARRRGLDARVIDGQRLPFDGEFDAVFTNAALHWMPDLPLVLAGVHRALRPGGRFVGEFAGVGNIADIGLAVTAARLRLGLGPADNPWRTSDADEFAALCNAAELTVDLIEEFPRPTPLPNGLASWLRIFGEPLLADVDRTHRDDVIDAAVQLARPWMTDRHGRWTAGYRRLRFRVQRSAPHA
jgi:SAM-dependent methyltransferase